VPAEALRHAVRRLSAGESLSIAETASAFREVMSGEGTPVLIASLLTALRVKGETPAEVAGAATALREAMTPLLADSPDTLVDTCGTGGGAVATFNISTAAALVVAGAGIRVAKHGNRSMTTQCGSADVLEALGVAIDIPAERMPRVLEEAGIVFMFAPTMHPAMRHVGPVRRELGIPTLMNMVGPLANPAKAGRQVIGVSDPLRAQLMAGALATLGTVHSLVVHGEPGMDEVSPIGKTSVIEVRGESLTTWTIDPADLGFTALSRDDLAGADPARNAATVESVLRGTAAAGAEAAVLLNAGAAILVSGRASTLPAAIQVAREAISSGSAAHSLEKLRRATRN
jgi:anthranilate phosphoribosyltransferase